MFCVIQETKTKKTNKNGYSKKLVSEYMEMSINGQDCSHYHHYYSAEKFERPIMKSYRISIHHSYRENGKVKKKQFVLCTVNYYDFATGIFSVYDYCEYKIHKVSEELSKSIDEIYEIVEGKVNQLQEKIFEEFSETEEYKTHEEHEKIIAIYTAQKVQFAHEYGVDAEEYDKCYDVFGELKNPEYLERIKTEFRQKKEKEYSSYYKSDYGNYNGNYSGQGSGCYNFGHSNYNDDNKEILKQFYRTLSKKFHPDANPNTDTSQHMKLINQLKKEWNL